MFRLLLLLIFFCFCRVSVFGQLTNIRFDAITIENGLSQSTPNVIYQDKKGFIWIGTQDGLNLYDGYKFKIYYNDPDDSLSLCDNFIHAIAEDSLEHIWIGTENGLCYFSRAENRFINIDFNKYNRYVKKSNVVNALCFDNEQNLWIGTDGAGLFKIKFSDLKNPISDFRVEQYSTESSTLKLSDNAINTLLTYKNFILVGTQNGGLTIINCLNKTSLFLNNSTTETKKISSNTVTSIAIDNKKRRLFIGTNNGVDVLNTLDFTPIRSINTLNELSHLSVTSLLADSEDNLWIGTEWGINKLNLLTGRIVHFFNQSNNLHSLIDNKIESLFEDNAGVMWIGTTKGINKFDRIKQNFITFKHVENNPNSLSGDNIWSLYQDHHSIIWVGTDYGIDAINRKEGTIKHYYLSNNNTKINSVFKIYPWNNYFLVATENGVFNFFPNQNRFLPLKSKDNSYKTLNNKRSYHIISDNDKNIWISTREGLLLFEHQTQTFKLFTNDPLNPNSLPHNVVRMVYIDNKNQYYVATGGGGLALFTPIKNDKNQIVDLKFQVFKNISGNKKTINNNNILTIYQTSDELLWIGTYGGGLNCYNPQTQEFTHYTEKNGLSNNVIYGIVPDNIGNLWLSTNKGISCFNIEKKEFQNYYEQDGIQNNEFNIGAYAKGIENNILMGGINGFNLFYPSHFKRNNIPPKPSLTGLYVLNKEILPGKKSPIKQTICEVNEINLSYKENSFTLEFSALHYSNPANNKYSYILEGVDEDWNMVGNRNYASYTKVEPGEYLFKLKAANSDGIWSKQELVIKINIIPPFWKTVWFRLIASIAVVLIIWLAYRTRINIIKQQKKYLEQQIKERTQKIWQQKEEIELKNQELQKEKEKVEKLLLNILPTETVEELKSKGKAQARHYRTVSVMFTDFKGFTRKSENMRPQELVEMLDFYFIKFDEIIAKYNIEKIKTIGDAYMAAGGVPIRNKSNPIDIILAGLEIQRFVTQIMQERLQTGGNYFECRIGIHTGEVIAGVVGIKRFAYDIWGDTVNVASRMEASSEVGKVNISGETYQIAKEFFVCTYRGKIQAKNKGEIDMYFVEGIKPELSEDGKGIIPNQAFKDRLEHILYSKINYKRAEQHIVKLLENSLPAGLYYHGLHHTLDVCKAAEEIAILEGIEGEDLHILKTAALFHDAGFVHQYSNNEVIGCKMAEEILPEFGYSAKQIKMVQDLILATIVPQKPKNLLEEIICDADLDYLGRDAEEYYKKAQSLFEELKAFGKMDDPLKWIEIQISFLSQHTYFTKTNKNRRTSNKLKRLEELKEKVKFIKQNSDNN